MSNFDDFVAEVNSTTTANPSLAANPSGLQQVLGNIADKYGIVMISSVYGGISSGIGQNLSGNLVYDSENGLKLNASGIIPGTKAGIGGSLSGDGIELGSQYNLVNVGIAGVSINESFLKHQLTIEINADAIPALISPTGGTSLTFVEVNDYLEGDFREKVFDGLDSRNIVENGVITSSDRNLIYDDAVTNFKSALSSGKTFDLQNYLAIKEFEYGNYSNGAAVVYEGWEAANVTRYIEKIPNSGGDYLIRSELVIEATGKRTFAYSRVSADGIVEAEGYYSGTIDPYTGRLVISTASENWNGKTLNELIEEVKESVIKDNQYNDPRCFAAGTQIDMADGSTKSIETIEIGDEVMAYDPEAEAEAGRGGLRPARVTRTMVNQVPHLLDFHGVRVTPGHATLSGDGPHAGKHIPLMDILTQDGAVVNREGDLLRAATNLPVGSEGDQFVEVAYITSKSQKTYFRGRMRAGTLTLDAEGKTHRVLDALKREGYRLLPDGLIAKDGETPHPLYWFGELPKPADYVLAKSGLTLAELYSAGEEQERNRPVPVSSSKIGAELGAIHAGMWVN
jgi:hypothetical protein